MSFTTTCAPTAGETILAPVRFSQDPPASFGNLQAESVPGTSVGGSVEIHGGIRGDCNADGAVDAADPGACGLEIFDGDGDHWLELAAGYPGSPVGCDSNADQIVDAGDLSCTARLIFGGSVRLIEVGSPAGRWARVSSTRGLAVSARLWSSARLI